MRKRKREGEEEDVEEIKKRERERERGRERWARDRIDVTFFAPDVCGRAAAASAIVSSQAQL